MKNDNREELRAHLLSMSSEERQEILAWLRQAAADLGVPVQGDIPADARQAHCDQVAASLLAELDL